MVRLKFTAATNIGQSWYDISSRMKRSISLSVLSALNTLNGFRCFLFLQNQDSEDAYSSSLEVLSCHYPFCKDQKQNVSSSKYSCIYFG